MKKIIYMAFGPDQPSFETYARLAEQTKEHVELLIKRVNISTKFGQPVEITFSVNSATPENKDTFFNAIAERIDDRQYQIILGAGLLAKFDLLSRALVADKTVLRGVSNSKLVEPQARKDGRTKVMADFFFHYLVDLIFWHEMAHIVLGHLDWLDEKKQERQMRELPAKALTPQQAAERRVLEADADHQASKWAVAMFDYSLNKNPHFRYNTIPDQFYDFGYLIASLFQIFDALEPDVPQDCRTHPDNHTRMFVSMAFLSEYFEKYHPAHSKRYTDACIQGALKALDDVIQPNSKPFNPAASFMFMHQTGVELDKLGVRKHMLKVMQGDSSIVM